MKTQSIVLIEVLAIIGIGLAIYLIWQQWYQPSFQPCSINATINCDAIISGPVAKTFGIPTPLIGLMGYISIFLAAIFRKTKALFGIASFGLAFCLWIAYKELVDLRVICPVCIACQLIMVSIFSFAFVQVRKQKHEKNK
jgi:uncharacterized membrane protein